MGQHGIYGFAAGNVAVAQPAHAIRHNAGAHVRVHRYAVFIAPANPAGICPPHDLHCGDRRLEWKPIEAQRRAWCRKCHPGTRIG